MEALSSDLERKAAEWDSRAIYASCTAERLHDQAGEWHAKAAGLRVRARQVAALEAANEAKARMAAAVPAEEEQ